MMYRHGLRISEAIGLRRDDVDLGKSRLWVERLKGSLAVEHPIAGDELRGINRSSPRATTSCRGCSFPSAGRK